MGKSRAIIALVLALGVAVLTSAFVYRWVGQNRTHPKVVAPAEKSVPVAVAVADLPWATKLSRDMIRVVPFFEKSLPKGYFSDINSLEGRVVLTPLKENEAIIESKLAPPSVTTGGVSAIVSPEKRALAVKGDKVIGLSGFIRPGDRVDVLVTLTDTRYKRVVTKIVLEGILVLATGTQMENDGEKGKGGETSPVDVYTLEVTPEEGEKLALAATEGRLQFALRNPTDVKTVLTTGATIPKTLASFRPPRKKRRVSSRPRTKNDAKQGEDVFLTVQVIKGGEVSKIKLNTNGGF
ncbi:MAG: Flp pilus assembly protein CpaB [Proteobacteria bacterium]|nr:Flp pilus assembly protein CpaB [Pseudomonadota bacterium]